MEQEYTIIETMVTPIGIRELSPDEWRDYESLRHEMLHMDPEAFPPQAYDDLTKPEEFWRSRIEQGSVIVAYDGLKPIGMVRASYDAESAKLWNMYAKAEYRGRGVGKQLMAGIIDQIVAHGATSATLEVEDTQIPARNMYENVFGFRETGREVNERGGYMITMQRTFNPK